MCLKGTVLFDNHFDPRHECRPRCVTFCACALVVSLSASSGKSEAYEWSSEQMGMRQDVKNNKLYTVYIYIYNYTYTHYMCVYIWEIHDLENR
jgi:hypothetical protein